MIIRFEVFETETAGKTVAVVDLVEGDDMWLFDEVWEKIKVYFDNFNYAGKS
jgi:hypothetical protein